MRCTMAIIAYLDDGHGLRDGASIIQLEQGHQPVGRLFSVVGLTVLPLHEVDRHIGVGQTFERQSNANAKRGRRTKVAVQLHRYRG